MTAFLTAVIVHNVCAKLFFFRYSAGFNRTDCYDLELPLSDPGYVQVICVYFSIGANL